MAKVAPEHPEALKGAFFDFYPAGVVLEGALRLACLPEKPTSLGACGNEFRRRCKSCAPSARDRWEPRLARLDSFKTFRNLILHNPYEFSEAGLDYNGFVDEEGHPDFDYRPESRFWTDGKINVDETFLRRNGPQVKKLQSDFWSFGRATPCHIARPQGRTRS